MTVENVEKLPCKKFLLGFLGSASRYSEVPFLKDSRVVYFPQGPFPQAQQSGVLATGAEVRH